LKVKFNIVAIIETWIEPNLINDFHIQNYDAFHITRGTRRGGGVAIYTNQKLWGSLVESKSYVVDNILECVTTELTINWLVGWLIGCLTPYKQPWSIHGDEVMTMK